jgi:hypothetical protein
MAVLAVAVLVNWNLIKVLNIIASFIIQAPLAIAVAAASPANAIPVVVVAGLFEYMTGKYVPVRERDASTRIFPVVVAHILAGISTAKCEKLPGMAMADVKDVLLAVSTLALAMNLKSDIYAVP